LGKPALQQEAWAWRQVDDRAAVRDGLGHLGDFHRTVANGFIGKSLLVALCIDAFT